MLSAISQLIILFEFVLLFRVLFSEAYANVSMIMLYYGNEEGEIGAHFPFNFDFVTDLSARSNARDFVYIILRWLTYMPYGGVANWVVSFDEICFSSSYLSVYGFILYNI